MGSSELPTVVQRVKINNALLVKVFEAYQVLMKVFLIHVFDILDIESAEPKCLIQLQEHEEFGVERFSLFL